MMSERNHHDSFISFNGKHTPGSCEPNPEVPKITDCKMHIKVIVSQAAAAEEGSKLHAAAAASK